MPEYRAKLRHRIRGRFAAAMAKFWVNNKDRVIDPNKEPRIEEDNKVFLALLDETLDTVDEILKETYYSEEEYNHIVSGDRRKHSRE